MPDVKLTVAHERPAGASVLRPTLEALPSIRAPGPTRYLCGGCDILIFEGNIRAAGQVLADLVACPACGALLVIPVRSARDG